MPTIRSCGFKMRVYARRMAVKAGLEQKFGSKDELREGRSPKRALNSFLSDQQDPIRLGSLDRPYSTSASRKKQNAQSKRL